MEREAQGEGPALDSEKRIQTLEAEEAALYCQRGYGGYIDTGLLGEIRAEIQTLKAPGRARTT